MTKMTIRVGTPGTKDQIVCVIADPVGVTVRDNVLIVGSVDHETEVCRFRDFALARDAHDAIKKAINEKWDVVDLRSKDGCLLTELQILDFIKESYDPNVVYSEASTMAISRELRELTLNQVRHTLACLESKNLIEQPYEDAWKPTSTDLKGQLLRSLVWFMFNAYSEYTLTDAIEKFKEDFKGDFTPEFLKDFTFENLKEASLNDPNSPFYQQQENTNVDGR